MRNLFVMLLAFGLAAGANAQNSSTKTQNGSNNVASIMQSGNNTSTLNQQGDRSIATVDQTGRNTSTINQTDVTASAANPSASGHSATVTQTGGSVLANTSLIDQTNVASGVAVNGNNATVLQGGDGQNARVRQVNSRQMVANIDQGNGLGTGSNVAFVEQSSSRGSESVMNQRGTLNNAYSFQSFGGFSKSDIKQDGTSNDADVFQDRNLASGGTINSPRSLAFVTQSGVSNKAYVDQTLRINAEARITQTGGDSNDARIDQSNNIEINPSHYASITQMAGNSNFARIQQEGSASASNRAELTQRNGDLNDARLRQEGLGGDHEATVMQDGSSNLLQGLGGTGTFALQAGTGHTLNVTQMGTSNVGMVSQTGVLGHTGTINQTGTGNSATVNQMD